MGTTIEQQVQAATATISAALAQIGTDLTTLAGRLTPGSTVTQEDSDALTAVAAAASNIQAQADAAVAGA